MCYAARLWWPCLLTSLAAAQAQFAEVRREALPADDAASSRASLLDVDGDGDLDLFSSGATTAQACRLYRNDGRGRFTADPAFAATAVSGPHLVADVEGDGDLDILVPGFVIENRGAAPLLVLPSNMQRWPRAFGDVDGDQRGDLVCVDGLGLSIWREVSAGNWVQLATPPQGFQVSDAALADLDADGDLDLVLATSTTGNPLMPGLPGFEVAWRNDGVGGFTDLSSVWLPLATDDLTNDLVVADFDGDGDVDCGFLSYGWSGITYGWRFRQNDGTGRLVPWVGPALPALTLDVIDLDEDSDLDLVRGDQWFANDGAGNFTARTIEGPWLELRGAGDVDGDGDLDLVLGGQGPNGGGHRLLLDTGGQSFVDATAFPWSPLPTLNGSPTNPSAQPNAIEGDVDGDGDLDLLQLGGPLLQNDGGGWFMPRPFPWAAIPQFLGAPAFVDLDADGDLDVLYIATPNAGPAELRQARNDGSGVFTDPAPTVVPTPLPGWGVATVLDADGDGDPDFALGTYYLGLFLFANGGAGQFAPVPAAFPTLFSGFSALVAADFDGDGDLDVLAGSSNWNGSNLNMLVNDGTGVFTDTPSWLSASPGIFVTSLHAFDADRDGDFDAFVGNRGDSANVSLRHALLRNDGTGRLAEIQSALPGIYSGGPASIGDVDGDGSLDAVLQTSQGLRYWRNNGLGQFVDRGSISVPQAYLHRGRLVDLDDDGDADLLHGHRLWPNRQWHLEAPHLPRLGCVYTLRLGGMSLPSAVALPFFGGPVRIPLPPFGTLGLDPATAIQLPAVSITNGSGELSATIPALPGLLGLSFSVQAVLVGGGQVHLTPAKRETIFD